MGNIKGSKAIRMGNVLAVLLLDFLSDSHFDLEPRRVGKAEFPVKESDEHRETK